MIEFKHIGGKNIRHIAIYALSTCVWCKKTKKLLSSLGIAYDYIDVDLLDNDKAKEAEKEIKKWNPKSNFPTTVIDNNRCIVGFKEKELKELANE